MPVLKLTQIIERPVEDVFAAIIDVASFPKWNPTTKSARRLSSGETGNGTRFELEIAGFGKVEQILGEFEPNRRVTLVPQMKMMGGGHRFILTAEGRATRIDHELEMFPKGIFELLTPFVGMMGRKNLGETAVALKKYLETPR